MNFTDLKVVGGLTLAHIRHRPTRMILTLLATTAAACVVVWVVSGYDSLVAKFDEFSDEYLGRYSFFALPTTDVPVPGSLPNQGTVTAPPQLTPELVASLREDPAVLAVDAVFQSRATITKVGAGPGGGFGPEGGSAPGGGSGRRPRGERTGEATGDATPTATAQATGEATTAATSQATGESTGQPTGGGRGRGGFGASPSLVGTEATEPPHDLIDGKWLDQKNPDALEAVISAGAAEALNVKVGDEVFASRAIAGFGGRGGNAEGAEEPAAPAGPGGARGPGAPRGERLKLKVVGVVKQTGQLPRMQAMVGLPPSKQAPLQRGPAGSSLYVALPLAEKILGEPARYDYAGVVLKPDMSVDEFDVKWTAALAKQGSPAYLQSLADVGAELGDSSAADTIKTQANAATGISLLASLFIIFSTLSMGVDERIRQFAMLRAVAFTKAQVATMIVLESLVFGVIGWIAGVVAGALLLQVLLFQRPEWVPIKDWFSPSEWFPNGSQLGPWTIGMAGVCAVGGALLAAILPAWKATRVKPLEAMSPQSSGPARFSWLVTILGLILVSVNPLLVFYVPMEDTSRYFASAAIGSVCMGVGFVLLAPATIFITEKFFAPLTASLFGVNPLLLNTQLTTNLWRTLGTTVSLTLGLGLFIAMQTWGYTMLAPYYPGEWSPDVVAVVNPVGLPDEAIEDVRKIPGVKPDRVALCVSEQVRFATDVTGSQIRSSSSRQDNCTMVGIDPDLGLGGADPMFDFPFVSGTREEALAKLKQGRFCIAVDHFERESGLHVGDKFGVTPFDKPDEVIEYEIAGIVRMTGWHWMSKVGLRNRNGGRTAGLMFASRDQIKSDYGVKRNNAVWFDVDGVVSAAEMEAATKVYEEKLAAYYEKEKADAAAKAKSEATRDAQPAAMFVPGFSPVPRRPTEQTVFDARIAASLDAVAEKYFDRSLLRAGGGRASAGAGVQTGLAGAIDRSGARPSATNVQMRSREGTRLAIRERADAIIWILSQLPLVTLLVTSLGVANTVAASVRARRWDMGVMRTLGVTRSGLFRLILCEALLVAVAACLLSFAFGLMAGYCGVEVTRYTNVRGGQITPLVIEWSQIGKGFAVTFALCLVAALWPAMRTGRTEPLELLQAGRAAM